MQKRKPQTFCKKPKKQREEKTINEAIAAATKKCKLSEIEKKKKKQRRR